MRGGAAHKLRSLAVGASIVSTVPLTPGIAQARGGGCITRLPAAVTLASDYAAVHRHSVHLRVHTRGPKLRRTYASLYAFSGELIARSRKLNVRSSRLLRLRLRHGPMQPGNFTLVVTGEPNGRRSCGPKTYTRVLSFRACSPRLPVVFPEPPGGRASGYADTLSVAVRTTGPFLRDVRSSVYTFDGRLVGRASVGVLFGEAMLDHQLNEPLAAGSYTVLVDAEGGQPPECGLQRATQVLEFT